MAPKKEQKAHDAEADAASQIYQVAQAEMQTKLETMQSEIGAIREESQAMGALKAIESTIAFQEMMKVITLKRVKDSKEYKKGGMTWLEFCDSLGLVSRTVDMQIADIQPVVAAFSENFSGFCGLPFSKIRLLGRSVSENVSEIKNNCLVYGDESIPLTPEHAEDIQALIERIAEEGKAAKEEAEANLAAKDKVLKSKQELLNKQEKTLRKYEKDATAKGLTPDEDAFIQLMTNKCTSFEGYMLSTDPDHLMENAGEVTPRMRACLIANLHYMKMQILAAYDTAVLNYGGPSLNPELMEEFEAWEKAQGGGN